MRKVNNKIQTQNGTTIGERAVTSDGKPAMRVKSGHHSDIITPEQAAEYITGLPVEKIVYAKTSTSPG